jgi:hypothetical protein
LEIFHFTTNNGKGKFIEEKSKIQQSLQTQKNINVDDKEKKNKEKLKILHLQGRKWKHMIVVMHYVGHFIV